MKKHKNLLEQYLYFKQIKKNISFKGKKKVNKNNNNNEYDNNQRLLIRI